MSDTGMALLAIFGVIMLFIILAIIGPIALIWALNTLFYLAIPFSFKTWFAGLLLIVIITPATQYRKK